MVKIAQRLAAGMLAVLGLLAGWLPARPAAADAPAAPATQPASPKLELVQVVKRGDPDLPKTFDGTGDVAFIGNYLYVTGTPGIVYFKRDLNTGKVAYVGEVTGGCTFRRAGGKLYAVSSRKAGMTCFEPEAETGKLVEKGKVECPPTGTMVVSPDEKDIYVRPQVEDRLLWFHLDADGKPVKAGEVTGKGITRNHPNYGNFSLQQSPDGKFLYTISEKDHALAWVERKPTGEITYKGAADLDPVAKHPQDSHGISLAISPDGKWLYARVGQGKKPESFFGIFKRNPDTGEPTFQETVSGEKEDIAMWPPMLTMPSKEGANDWVAFWMRQLYTFTVDPQTGHMTHLAVVKESGGMGAQQMALDAENGFLYVASCGDGVVRGFYVFKVAKKPAAK